MDQLYIKLENLKAYLKSLDSVAIAFSGGVDSTFLTKVAYEVLGDQAIAVTATSSTYPEREFKEAVDFAAALGIRHISCISEELDISGFSANPTNRCYLCKKELITKIKEIADLHGLAHIVEGSNMDDTGDYRPGLIAIKELDVKSPLRQAGLTKEDIRKLSRDMGLATWDKPSFACLASRFPYGEIITESKLAMVDKAEQFLHDQGLRQVRVRNHENMARIEIEEQDYDRFLEPALRNLIQEHLKALGYAYISLDLKSYRTGSMNETLSLEDRYAE